MKVIPAALLTLLAPLLILATLVFQHGTGAAQGSVELATDADPDGNSATSLGPREGCISVDADDTFEFDIVVSDIDDLVAWELYLRFDPSIIEVVDADMDDMFLDSNPGSSLIKKSERYVGRHFLGAADRRLVGASGSGILARVTLHAIAPGTSDAEIFYHDFDRDGDDDFGPRLTDSDGSAVGDVTGDRVFDGPTYHALIAVNESCDVPTPTPVVPPSPTPPPGGGTAPSDTPPPPDALPVPGDPTFEPPPTDDGSASDDGQDSATDGEPDEENTEDSDSDGADDSEDGSAPAVLAGQGTSGPSEPENDSGQAAGGDSSPSTSSGGGLPLWAIGSIAAAVLVAAGGASVFLASRAGGRSGR